VDDGGHPGAADEVDVEVRANLVTASSSYSCPSEFLSSSSTQLARASADNVLEYGQSENETSVVAKSSLFH